MKYIIIGFILLLSLSLYSIELGEYYFYTQFLEEGTALITNDKIYELENNESFPYSISGDIITVNEGKSFRIEYIDNGFILYKTNERINEIYDYLKKESSLPSDAEILYTAIAPIVVYTKK